MNQETTPLGVLTSEHICCRNTAINLVPVLLSLSPLPRTPAHQHYLLVFSSCWSFFCCSCVTSLTGPPGRSSRKTSSKIMMTSRRMIIPPIVLPRTSSSSNYHGPSLPSQIRTKSAVTPPLENVRLFSHSP